MISPRQLVEKLDARLAREGNLGASLLKAAAGTAGLKVAFTGIGFLVSIALARGLGPGGYGVYSYVMALVALLVIPSELGMPALMTREVAVTNARKDWGHMRGLIRRAHQATGLFTVVLTAIGAAALWVWGDRVGPARLGTMWVGLLLVPIVSLNALRSSMLRGLRKVLLAQFPEQIVRPLAFLILIVVVAAAASGPMTPAQVMGLQVAATAAAFVCGLILFLRHRPPELLLAVPAYKTAFWLKSSVPFGLTAAMQLINGRTDIFVLGLFRADHEIGIYRVACQIAALVTFGLSIVNSVQGPHIAHLYATGDKRRLQQMVTRSSRGILLITLVIVAAILLFGKVFLDRVYGIEYASAFVPLVILCVGQLVSATAGSVASLLNMTGHERDTMKGLMIAASLNLVLNFTLTPLWGATGSALATASTLITWNLFLLRIVHVRIGIHPSAFFRPKSG